jgi:undecaprenyl-diphosphatase
MNRSAFSFANMAERELALCTVVNRLCVLAPLTRLFALVSWLGNGKAWYALMLALPLVYGRAGFETAFLMAAAGLVGLFAYKAIKRRTHRLRPYACSDAIRLGARPLDAYSFPSGHTLHAVAFTLIVTERFPELAVVLVPFAVLVAASRVVLGLHYPSDVAMGAAIGWAIARVTLALG